MSEAEFNVNELFDQDNKIILKMLFENKGIFQDDLSDNIAPLQQHRWEVMSRKLQLFGLQYSWTELREKFRYWMKSGFFTQEYINTNYKDEDKYSESMNQLSLTYDDDKSDGSDLSDFLEPYSGFSNANSPSMPRTSTPKDPSKCMTNIVCNVTISPMNNQRQYKNNVNQREEEFANKSVQTSKAIEIEDIEQNPAVYYIDPVTNELQLVKENEVLVLNNIANSEPTESKKRKLEMSSYERSLYQQHKKLCQQKMEQRTKEHEMRMKLLEAQLKSKTESHEALMEIAKLQKEILIQQFQIEDSEK